MVLFVETKTKAEQHIKYRDWQTIQKQGYITNKTRGGSLILLKPTIPLGKANPPSINRPLNECLHFTIPFDNEQIHIFLVYIHPHQPLEKNIFSKAAQYKYVIIIGDFNLNPSKRKQLQSFLDNSSFKQRHTEPTFLMPANNDTTPDILIHTENIMEIVKDISLTGDLCSDHLAITFKICTNQSPSIQTEMTKYNLTRTNVQKVNEDMTTYINKSRTTQISETFIQDFHNHLTQAIIRYSPKTRYSPYTYTLPKYILEIIYNKRRIYREYKLTNNNILKNELNRENKKIQKLIQKYQLERWLQTCKEIETDRGRTYWQKIKKVTKYKKTNNIPTITYNNIEYRTDQQKCDILAQHFQSALTPKPNQDYDNYHQEHINEWYKRFLNMPTNAHKGILEVTHEEYDEHLSKGKNSCPGLDLITKKLLRQLNPEIHNLIRKIFNFCIQNLLFPSTWKKATVITIPKPGANHSLPQSYRPITLLSVIGKIYESILNSRILHLIKDKIPIHQFGFKQKQSTIHPLIILTNNIQLTNLQHRKTAILFLDINKAFDTVWHQGLLYKMDKMGIPTPYLKIIDEYLRDRILSIKINNATSFLFSPLQGVPQGSPISPTLYNIYCYDIYPPTNPDTNNTYPDNYILQYADDTTLISHGKNLQTAVKSLQTQYNNILSWFNKWRVTPNPDKFQLLIPHSRTTDQSQYITTGTSTTKPTNEVKYLGITLDNKMKFKSHYKKMQTEVTRRAKHFRSLTYKDKGISVESATQIYKSICRPLLDYGHLITICSPESTKELIRKAERKCLRILTKIRHPNNPLHNINNEDLYAKTKMTPITVRYRTLTEKFSRNAEQHALHYMCKTRSSREGHKTLYEELYENSQT